MKTVATVLRAGFHDVDSLERAAFALFLAIA